VVQIFFFTLLRLRPDELKINILPLHILFITIIYVVYIQNKKNTIKKNKYYSESKNNSKINIMQPIVIIISATFAIAK